MTSIESIEKFYYVYSNVKIISIEIFILNINGFNIKINAFPFKNMFFHIMTIQDDVNQLVWHSVYLFIRFLIHDKY